MHSRTPPTPPTPRKRLLAGLFGAWLACAAAAVNATDATDSAPLPSPDPARAGMAGDIPDSCSRDVESISREIERFNAIQVPDSQAPEQRLYSVSDFDPGSLRLDHGRCVVDCSGAYENRQQLRRIAQGPCSWRPGDWGNTIRFTGGCALDQSEMSGAICSQGSISVADERGPEGAQLQVLALDPGTAFTGGNTCASTCVTPKLPPGMCHWTLFDWGGSIARSPAPEVACLSDYHEIQQQIRYYDSVLVPDALYPETTSHRVTSLLGKPVLTQDTCSAGCTTIDNPPATCTWTAHQWGQTVRYHGQPPAAQQAGRE